MKSLISGLSTAALVATSAVFATKAEAAQYCMTNTDNNYICIHNVFINRSNNAHRTIVGSVNGGNPVSFAVDCANPHWEATSIKDVACSEFH